MKPPATAKKAYELFNEFQPTYIMEVPQTKSEAAKTLFRSEVERFKDRIETLSGIKISEKGLKEAIKLVNHRRCALRRLNRLREASPAPISGLDALLINQVAFYDDPARFTEAVERLCDELDGRVREKNGVLENAKRIMIAGCPMAVPNWKIPYIIEGAGAVITGEESCIGVRHTRDDVDEDTITDGMDKMLDAVIARYI